MKKKSTLAKVTSENNVTKFPSTQTSSDRTHYTYLRTHEGKPLATLAIIFKDNRAYVGVSVCNESVDTFNKKLGRSIAEGRALRVLTSGEFGGPAYAFSSPSNVCTRDRINLVSWQAFTEMANGYLKSDKTPLFPKRISRAAALCCF